ncbi:MAG: PEP-CTERM sorting domain-containing protein, partial [bacterium]
MSNKPVVFTSWYDNARYCNWLHNDKPTGLQNNTTTEDGAYTLSGNTGFPSRNVGAKYFIATTNEWYKSAYYKGGSTNAGYWLYPTQSD